MDPLLEHRLNEIEAKLVEIGEHIFNKEVDSRKEPEKKYFVDKVYGPVGSYLTFKEERRSNRGRRRLHDLGHMNSPLMYHKMCSRRVGVADRRSSEWLKHHADERFGVADRRGYAHERHYERRLGKPGTYRDRRCCS